MGSYRLVVLTNPVAGRENEYNDWYTNTHLKDVVQIPGILSAQRFRMTPTQRQDKPPGPWKYLAIYSIEADDVTSVIGELAARRGTPKLRASDALAEERLAYYYEPITDIVTKPA